MILYIEYYRYCLQFGLHPLVRQPSSAQTLIIIIINFIVLVRLSIIILCQPNEIIIRKIFIGKPSNTTYWIFSVKEIPGISWAYLGGILGVSWGYLGISWVYLGHIFGIFWAYLRHIFGIFWAYLGHILVISWADYGHIHFCITLFLSRYIKIFQRTGLIKNWHK